MLKATFSLQVSSPDRPPLTCTPAPPSQSRTEGRQGWFWLPSPGHWCSGWAWAFPVTKWFFDLHRTCLKLCLLDWGNNQPWGNERPDRQEAAGRQQWETAQRVLKALIPCALQPANLTLYPKLILLFSPQICWWCSRSWKTGARKEGGEIGEVEKSSRGKFFPVGFPHFHWCTSISRVSSTTGTSTHSVTLSTIRPEVKWRKR